MGSDEGAAQPAKGSDEPDADADEGPAQPVKGSEENDADADEGPAQPVRPRWLSFLRRDTNDEADDAEDTAAKKTHLEDPEPSEKAKEEHDFKSDDDIDEKTQSQDASAEERHEKDVEASKASDADEEQAKAEEKSADAKSSDTTAPADGADAKSSEERRLAEDGKPYSWKEFQTCFKNNAAWKWQEAKPEGGGGGSGGGGGDGGAEESKDDWGKDKDSWSESKTAYGTEEGAKTATAKNESAKKAEDSDSDDAWGDWGSAGQKDTDFDELKKMSVKLLKAKCAEKNITIPAGLTEKSELVDLIVNRKPETAPRPVFSELPRKEDRNGQRDTGKGDKGKGKGKGKGGKGKGKGKDKEKDRDKRKDSSRSYQHGQTPPTGQQVPPPTNMPGPPGPGYYPWTPPHYPGAPPPPHFPGDIPQRPMPQRGAWASAQAQAGAYPTMGAYPNMGAYPTMGAYPSMGEYPSAAGSSPAAPPPSTRGPSMRGSPVPPPGGPPGQKGVVPKRPRPPAGPPPAHLLAPGQRSASSSAAPRPAPGPPGPPAPQPKASATSNWSSSGKSPNWMPMDSDGALQWAAAKLQMVGMHTPEHLKTIADFKQRYSLDDSLELALRMLNVPLAQRVVHSLIRQFLLTADDPNDPDEALLQELENHEDHEAREVAIAARLITGKSKKNPAAGPKPTGVWGQGRSRSRSGGRQRRQSSRNRRSRPDRRRSSDRHRRRDEDRRDDDRRRRTRSPEPRETWTPPRDSRTRGKRRRVQPAPQQESTIQERILQEVHREYNTPQTDELSDDEFRLGREFERDVVPVEAEAAVEAEMDYNDSPYGEAVEAGVAIDHNDSPYDNEMMPQELDEPGYEEDAPPDQPQDLDEGGEMEAWLNSLDNGKGVLLKYLPDLLREFGTVDMVALTKLPDKDEASIVSCIDASFFEAVNCKSLGHRLLFAKGIMAL